MRLQSSNILPSIIIQKRGPTVDNSTDVLAVPGDKVVRSAKPISPKGGPKPPEKGGPTARKGSVVEAFQPPKKLSSADGKKTARSPKPENAKEPVLVKERSAGETTLKPRKQSFLSNSERMLPFDAYQSKRTGSGSDASGFNMETSNSSIESLGKKNRNSVIAGSLGQGVCEEPGGITDSNSSVDMSKGNTSTAAASPLRKLKARRPSGLTLSHVNGIENSSPLSPREGRPIIDIETVKSLDVLNKKDSKELGNEQSKSQNSISSNHLKVKKRMSILSTNQQDSDSASSLSLRSQNSAEVSVSSSSNMPMVEESSSQTEALMETAMSETDSFPTNPINNATFTSPNPTLLQQRRTTLAGPAFVPLKQKDNSSPTSSKTRLEKQVVDSKKEKIPMDSVDLKVSPETDAAERGRLGSIDATSVDALKTRQMRFRSVSLAVKVAAASGAKFKKLAEIKKTKNEISPSIRAHWMSLLSALKLAIVSNRAAIQRIKNIIKTLDDKTLEEASTIQTHQDNSHKTATDFLSEISIEKESVSCKRLRSLLQVPPEERSSRHVDEIYSVMEETFPNFEKTFLDEFERHHICKFLRFDNWKKDTVLFWEEHLSTVFCFLAFGKVELFKLNKGAKLKLSIMKTGSIFGHAALNVENATRSTCAVLLQDSGILTISKSDYTQYVRDLNALHPKIVELSKLSVFANNKEAFEKISRFVILSMHKAGTRILEQTDMVRSVSWIVRGEITITQKIGIVVHRGKKTLKAYNVTESISPNASVMWVDLETQKGSEGFCYPRLPESGNDKKLAQYLGADHINLDAYRDDFQERKVLAPYNVIAVTDVTIASLSFSDIAQFLPKTILFQLIYHPVVADYTTEELTEQYLASANWESHRRKEIAGLKKPAHARDVYEI